MWILTKTKQSKGEIVRTQELPIPTHGCTLFFLIHTILFLSTTTANPNSLLIYWPRKLIKNEKNEQTIRSYAAKQLNYPSKMNITNTLAATCVCLCANYCNSLATKRSLNGSNSQQLWHWSSDPETETVDQNSDT